VTIAACSYADASRRLFDEECDSDCTGLTTQRQRLPTTTTTISSAAYLPTDNTYWNSCFLTRQTINTVSVVVVITGLYLLKLMQGISLSDSYLQTSISLIF